MKMTDNKDGSCNLLTLTTLRADSADDMLMIFFLFFPEK